MVNIELKGMFETAIHKYNKTFPIARFKAGVVLKNDGTVVIQLSSKSLTKKFKKVFLKEIVEIALDKLNEPTSEVVLKKQRVELDKIEKEQGLEAVNQEMFRRCGLLD